MPSKKKKYNSRFPPARIKKIMQTDEEIGKVAAAVPVLISKCLEMFLASLLTKAGEVTKSKRAKTMSTSHLKQCIMTESMFDFLKDHVANIPDVQNEDEPSGSYPIERETVPRKVVRKRSLVKVKKTPKKRPKLGHHTNNNGSEEETDSADDVSENGSAHEGSDVALSSSFSSPGLLSPSIHSKLETKSSVGGSKGEKDSFHIPLESLLSGDKIPSSVEINKPLIMTTPDTSDHSSQEERKTDSNQKSSLVDTEANANEKFKKENLKHVNETDKAAGIQAVRQGVIVANTAAYLQTTNSTSLNSSPSSSTMPSKDSHIDLQHDAPRKNLHMPYHEAGMDLKRNETEESGIDQKKESVKTSTVDGDPVYKKGEDSDSRQSTGENSLLQVVPPHPSPGGMLSLLYSSVSLPITSIPVHPTVQQSSSLKPTQGSSSRVQSLPYTYSPLSQHHLHRADGHEQRSSVLYHNISSHVDRAPRAQNLHRNLSEQSRSIPMSTNDECSPPHLSYGSVPFPYPTFAPYHQNQAVNPYASQAHFLGYPRTILTPPSHLSSMGIGSHLAAHPGLSHAKPGKTRTKSDEEDYDT